MNVMLTPPAQKLLTMHLINKSVPSDATNPCSGWAVKWLTGLLWVVSVVSGQTGIIDDFVDVGAGNRARTVFQFLNLPQSASQLARNFIASPYAFNANDVFSAPSATGFLSQYHFSATHLEWLMGLRKEYAGACLTLLDQGTVGFYCQAFTLGSFDYARTFDETVSKPNAVEMSLGVSYGRQVIHKKLSLGVGLSYVESRLEESKAGSFNATIDALYRYNNRFSAHVYGRNIGPEVMYNNTAELQPLQAGVDCRFSTDRRQDTTGKQTHALQFAGSFGLLKQRDAPLQIGLGFDASILKPLILHAGYEYSYLAPVSAEGISTGFSFLVGKMSLDCGWKNQSSLFGSVWSLTVNYATDEMIPRNAWDYYHVANRFYTKKHYNSCISYAMKALKLNPNLWQAHALIADAQSKIYQKQGSEIVMLYTGTTRGHFLPEQVNGMFLGGLAHQAQVVKQQLEQYPYVFAIDCGDNLSPLDSSSKTKAAILDSYFQRVAYAAAGFGPSEIQFPAALLSQEIRNAPRFFITDDNSTLAGRDVIKTKTFTLGSYTIAVVSLISAPFLGISAPDTIFSQRCIELQRQLQSSAMSNANFRILIAFDTWENIIRYSQQVEQLHCIIAAAMDSRLEQPIMIGSTAILSNGAWGRYVGKLTIRFDGAKKVQSLVNGLIGVNDQIPADTQLARLIDKIGIAVPQSADTADRSILSSHNPPREFIPFISDKRGKPNLYVKLFNKKHEIPLCDTSMICHGPVASQKADAILYFGKQLNEPYTRLYLQELSTPLPLPLNFETHALEACFSPDGKWVYAVCVSKNGNSRQTDLCRISRSGGQEQRLISWDNASTRFVSIAPDGTTLLFTSDSAGGRHLYCSDTNGTSVTRITTGTFTHQRPLFSPDSRSICYLSDQGNFSDNFDLWVYECESGSKTRLTTDCHIGQICWLPDGKRIAYTAGYNLMDLYLFDLQRGESMKITPPGIKEYSITSPMVFNKNKQTCLLYVRRYLDGRQAIFTIGLDGSGDSQFTYDTGNSWLE
ncbi:MAG: PD40 domain-containing protein [Chitinivibrionales bacterium]|nr:PD40 domain-containing protein [Chitinivibrionales bacterium]